MNRAARHNHVDEIGVDPFADVEANSFAALDGRGNANHEIEPLSALLADLVHTPPNLLDHIGHQVAVGICLFDVEMSRMAEEVELHAVNIPALH